MITQDEIAQIIAQYVGQRPFEDMAEDRSDLRGKIRDGYDVNEPTRDDCREAAADILARADKDRDDVHECGQQSGLMYARILVGEFLSESHPDLNEYLQAELEVRGNAIESRRAAGGEKP